MCFRNKANFHNLLFITYSFSILMQFTCSCDGCWNYELSLSRNCESVQILSPGYGNWACFNRTICVYSSCFVSVWCWNHSMKYSKAFCLHRAAISSLPFEIDDPSFPAESNEVVTSFYNGAISANVMYGSILPLTCPIYSSNFTFGILNYPHNH